ncbi:MAG TPA: hypothetical protein VJB09_00175 [Candidatus Paceibacterota bacterium]
MSYDVNNDLAGGSDEYGAEEKEPNFDKEPGEPELGDLDLIDDVDSGDAYVFGGDEEEETY